MLSYQFVGQPVAPASKEYSSRKDHIQGSVLIANCSLKETATVSNPKRKLLRQCPIELPFCRRL